MKNMILLLATLISLAGCREKEDDRTLDFTLVGDWEVESTQYARGKEDDWLNTSIEIRAIDNEQFIFNVQGAPSDTIWPVTSVWKKLVESETEIVLHITNSKSFNRPEWMFALLELDVRIFKHPPDRIRVFRLVQHNGPSLEICCDWVFNMKRKTEQLK